LILGGTNDGNSSFGKVLKETLDAITMVTMITIIFIRVFRSTATTAHATNFEADKGNEADADQDHDDNDDEDTQSQIIETGTAAQSELSHVLEVSGLEVAVHEEELLRGSVVEQRDIDAGRVVAARHSETEIGALVNDGISMFEMDHHVFVAGCGIVPSGVKGPIEHQFGVARVAHPGVAVDVHVDLAGGHRVVEGAEREGRVHVQFLPVTGIGGR